jgi:PAS domain S-box-containing protein
VRRWARELSGADGVTFVLRDREHCYYADESAIGPLWKGRRFPIKDCISGWAMLHREAVVIPDIYQDARIPFDAYRPTFVKSLAMVPVRQQDPIAAIGAYWADHHTANAREVALLQALANATSIALAKAELFLDVCHERDRFEQLTESLPQLVWTASVHGHARHLNQRWAEFTGLSLQELHGAGWQRAVHSEDLTKVFEHWRAGAASGSFEAEARLRRADGEWRWMLIRGVLIQHDGRRDDWVGTCTDIDAQKQSEQAKTEAIRLRDDFITVASHELKTPLTALQFQMHSLLHVNRKRDSEERPAPQLDRASRQVERLVALVEQLLDVSHFTAGKLSLQLESFDLRDLVAEVADRFADAARKTRSELQLRLPEHSAIGKWDRTRIEQTVNNLLDNAMKYGAGKPVTIELNANAERIALRVRDEGIGMTSEAQARIFDRFERAVPVSHYGGLGLGLYIARQIVTAHGGRLEVESSVGEGSTFTMLLPMVS